MAGTDPRLRSVTAERFSTDRQLCDVPGCSRLGRLFPCGWRCDPHRPGAEHGRRNPTPDPARSLEAIARTGHVEAMRRSAWHALELRIAPSLLRDALEDAIRGYDTLHGI